MKTWSPIALLLLVPLILTIACEEASEPDRLGEVGDPCRSARQHCLSDATAQVCEDRVWVERDCESLCAELGPAYYASGCDFECVCSLVDPSGCTPGQSVCIDDETVGVCDELQVLEPRSCTERCAEVGLHEAGCREDDDGDGGRCWCTAEGTPCSATAAPTCVDQGTLAACEEGVWVFDDCAVLCDGPGVCDPLRELATCAC